MDDIVYADANVYLAMFLGEKGRWLNPCDEAVNFFNRVFDKEFKLGYSEFVVYEVKNRLREKGKDENLMQEFLDTVEAEDQLVLADQEPADKTAAKKIDVHYQDPLHAILAKKIGCWALVTYNLRDFPPICCSWLTICKPESLP